MTQAAQQALRRTIELFSNTTRFALACNNSDKIIEAIQSRCAILRYTKLSDVELLKRLLEVCDQEHVVKTDEGLEAIIFTAQGDMRQALNNLQSTFSGFGVVNSENVFKVCDQPHPLLVKSIVEACLKCEIDMSYRGKFSFEVRRAGGGGGFGVFLPLWDNTGTLYLSIHWCPCVSIALLYPISFISSIFYFELDFPFRTFLPIGL